MRDGVFQKSFARQPRIVARRPARTPAVVELNAAFAVRLDFASGARRLARGRMSGGGSWGHSFKDLRWFSRVLAAKISPMKTTRRCVATIASSRPFLRSSMPFTPRRRRRARARRRPRKLPTHRRRRASRQSAHAHGLVDRDRRHVPETLGQRRHADGRSADRQPRRTLRGPHVEFLRRQRGSLRQDARVRRPAADRLSAACGSRPARSASAKRGSPPNRLDTLKTDTLIRRAAFSSNSPWSFTATADFSRCRVPPPNGCSRASSRKNCSGCAPA